MGWRVDHKRRRHLYCRFINIEHLTFFIMLTQLRNIKFSKFYC
ncbi:unnamed protein product [Brassica oleracea]|uniref:(rape) hypothetical protein n=1 Tax=Brassica napus TaxID=3708 RepID=A0A816KMH3_BRANA|nr:unnamed protein product [Brassica napus]